jgi:hypothetical protein
MRTMSAEKTFDSGDHVQWRSRGATIDGTVKKKLVHPTDIKGHHVAASPEHPEYLVESDSTGAQAAHQAGALKKTRRTAS